MFETRKFIMRPTITKTPAKNKDLKFNVTNVKKKRRIIKQEIYNVLKYNDTRTNLLFLNQESWVSIVTSPLPTNAGPRWRPPWGTLSPVLPPPPFPPLSKFTTSAGTTDNTKHTLSTIKSLFYFIFMQLCEFLEAITFLTFE